MDEWTRRIVALLLVIVANISPCALGAAFGVLSPAAASGPASGGIAAEFLLLDRAATRLRRR